MTVKDQQKIERLILLICSIAHLEYADVTKYVNGDKKDLNKFATAEKITTDL